MQKPDGKRRETMIYTSLAHRKITVPYIQCGVDSILRPALGVQTMRSSCWWLSRRIGSQVVLSCRSREPQPPLYSPGDRNPSRLYHRSLSRIINVESQLDQIFFYFLRGKSHGSRIDSNIIYISFLTKLFSIICHPTFCI